MKFRRALFYVPILATFAAFPATAATIWTLGPSPSGETVTFSDQQGPCVAGAKVAVWVKPGRDPVPACYRIEGGTIFLAFLDGDAAQLPAAMLKKATSL